jgi:hypothetical protein
MKKLIVIAGLLALATPAMADEYYIVQSPATVAVSAISLAAAFAFETAASRVSPTLLFTTSTASRAASAIVSCDGDEPIWFGE